MQGARESLDQRIRDELGMEPDEVEGSLKKMRQEADKLEEEYKSALDAFYEKWGKQLEGL